MKKILYVTATRAEFGKVWPLIEAAYQATYNVSVLVTGMHMEPEYGSTYNEVVKRCDSLNIPYYLESNSAAKGKLIDILQATISILTNVIARIQPDLVIFHGDRIEAFATGIVGSLSGVLTAHIEGGELSGTIDESLRHCNSKLSHQHFVANNHAATVLGQLGEEKNRVHIIGSPEIDIHNLNRLTIDEVLSHYGIKFKEYGILLFHPVMGEQDKNKAEIEHTLQSIIRSKRDFIVIGSNNDPGSEDIRRSYEAYGNERIAFFPSMRFEYFSILLRNCSILIGNSSAGIREAPYFGVQSVNIGSRQNGRIYPESVIQIPRVEDISLSDIINNFWGKKYKVSNTYGDGGAANRFINILDKNSFWEISKQKCFAISLG